MMNAPIFLRRLALVCALLAAGAGSVARGVESLVVTTTVDENNGTSDPAVGAGTSLREAVVFANTDGVNSAITFSPTVFAAPRKTITLAGVALGPIASNGTLSITAPAAGVVLDGSRASSVLVINGARMSRSRR